jgi:hypothetical protein
VAVLAAPTGLADKAALGLCGAGDRLAVGDLRPPDVRFDFVFATHAVDDDFEVEFAHAGDDGLPGLLVEAHAERRVFLDQPLQRVAQLLLVLTGLRLNRD